MVVSVVRFSAVSPPPEESPAGDGRGEARAIGFLFALDSMERRKGREGLTPGLS